MPSINRLVLLAVLSLSVYVQSAPVPDAALARAIAVNDVVAAREPELEEFDLQEREFDEEIEARAVKKAAVKAKPKAAPKAAPKAPPKAAPKAKPVAKKPVAVKPAPKKIAAKPAVKPAPKKIAAKPLAVKPAPKKIAAKPLAVKPVAKKPVGKPVAVKPVAKKPVAKPIAKPVKAAPAKTTTKAPAKACPIKKPATKAAPKKTKVRRAIEYITHLFERDNQEFIGWHGTNSDTATFWAQKGQLEKPVKADGFFDFIGIGPKSGAGTSGADAEIGPGVYVTDDQDIAVAFANNNAKVNPGTTAQLCAIFAKSQSNWRTAIRKAFIPETLVGDSSNPIKKASLESARIAHVKTAVPGVSATSVVKFSLLNRGTRTGQLVLPASITNQFTAQCFKADGGAAAAGTSKFPAFSYNGNSLRSQWAIAAETAGTAADCA